MFSFKKHKEVEKNNVKIFYEGIIDDLDLTSIQKKFLESTWLNYLLLMDKSASKGWISHNIAQISVIILSLLIPLIEMTSLNHKIFDLNLNVVGIMGFIIATLTTLNRQLGFEQKWKHYRKTAEYMRNEGDDFIALSGIYEKFYSHKTAFTQFAKIVTTFKRMEVNTYIEEQQKLNKHAEQNKQ